MEFKITDRRPQTKDKRIMAKDKRKMTAAVYLLLVCFVLPLFVISCAAQKGEDPLPIVKRMVAEENNIDYAGIKAITRRKNGETLTVKMKVAKKSPDKLRITFLEPPDKKGKEFVKIGKNFWSIDENRIKGKRHFRMFRRMNKCFKIRDLDLLLRNFTLKYDGIDKVSGRQCYVITIKPKRADRIWRKIWIDKEYYLALRSDEYYVHGGSSIPRSSFVYEKIEFDPPFTKSTFEVPLAAGARSVIKGTSRENITIVEALRTLIVPIYMPSYVPTGYKQVELKIFRRGKAEFLHALYSNGLSTISLFQGKTTEKHRKWMGKFETTDIEGQPVYRMKKGPLTILNTTIGNTSITLVGDISEKQLQKMFSSLEKVNK
ncbi:outer membrane lipoprotein-sorting protein [Candidatus Auribacterota bacterium]